MLWCWRTCILRTWDWSGRVVSLDSRVVILLLKGEDIVEESISQYERKSARIRFCLGLRY